MIAHTSIAVGNCAKAIVFYTKALAPLGYTNNMRHGDAAGFNDGRNTDFWIGEEETVVPTHVAFQAKDRGQVEEFYRIATEAGGRDNGRPGYRDYSPGYFAAFVLDPDGNNIEAVWYDEAKEA
jgi:catechol 2,3-dioxygenase-like lactoylglutathione lyase family enzyme